MSQGNSFGHLMGSGGQQSTGTVFDDPNARARENAEIERLRAQTRKAQADATTAGIKVQESVEDRRRYDDAQARKEVSDIFKTDTVLNAIRNARKIVQNDGGVGFESLLKGVPTTDARRLESELSPIFGNLAFDSLQQIREQSKTGGGLGSVSERELDLLGSTVASLDQGVDAATFLQRLDTIERHFINAQLAALGVDPDSEEGRAAIRNDYGYNGVFEGEEPTNTAALGRADATTAANELPPEYQAAHLRYLRDNWGQIDPQGYAAFRSGLDNQFGFTPDLGAYSDAVGGFNQAARQGITPEQLGAVPNPERNLSAIEQGINSAAQSAPGAAFANAANAFAGGLPAYLGGEQRNLNLLREARPISSFAGELAGGALGGLTVGGLAGRAGASALGGLGADAAFGTVSGATQDDNALRGAATGFAGSLAGSFIGNRIGQALPETFAQGAVNTADEAVPTVDALKSLANEQYATAQAAGEAASPEATQDIFERAQGILRREGRITPQGRMIDADTPTSRAMTLLEDFAGQPMRPQDANSVRKVLSEGVTNPEPSQRRIAGMLVDDFDQATQEVLPGISDARATAQRYLQGQQLQQRAGIGNIRGQRQKGNDIGDAMRTQFGQMDEQILKGQAHVTPEVADAVANVARGDRFTNALRSLGKFNLGNPITFGATAGGVTGVSSLAGVDPALSAGIGLGGAALGSAARKLAENRTARAAQNAEMLALGGDEWTRLFEDARRIAGRRAGGLFGGGAAVTAGSNTRAPR